LGYTDPANGNELRASTFECVLKGPPGWQGGQNLPDGTGSNASSPKLKHNKTGKAPHGINFRTALRMVSCTARDDTTTPVCRSSVSEAFRSCPNEIRRGNIMRQKNNLVYLQISSQVLTKRSNRRVLKRSGQASQPQNDDLFLLQHRIDRGFAGWERGTSAGRLNASLLRRGADWIFCSAPSSASNQLPTGLCKSGGGKKQSRGLR
jgi:hypothetical protein